jgi:hypothetical protein
VLTRISCRTETAKHLLGLFAGLEQQSTPTLSRFIFHAGTASGHQRRAEIAGQEYRAGLAGRTGRQDWRAGRVRRHGSRTGGQGWRAGIAVSNGGQEWRTSLAGRNGKQDLRSGPADRTGGQSNRKRMQRKTKMEQRR